MTYINFVINFIVLTNNKHQINYFYRIQFIDLMIKNHKFNNKPLKLVI